MKGKLIAFSLTLALLLSVLSVAGVGAHPVTIEAPNFVASRAEWFGQQPDFSGGAYVQRNKAQQGELIFKDITGSKTPDQRLISNTSVVTRAGDLAWFGVTADTKNVYFLTKVDRYNGITQSPSIELMITIDTNHGAGQTALPDGVTTNGVPTNVPADAAWEYTVDTKFSPGNGTVPYVNGTTKIFTNGTTSTNCDLTTCPSQLAGASVPQGSFAEIAVPWSQIGGQPLGGAFLRLTVSLMYSSRQSPSDGTSSPIIDVLGTTSTLADLQDKTLDTAIDVHFDPANNFEVYAPLLITEFYPNPVGKDAPGPTSPSNETEWIEIYNPNAFAVALSDYKIGNAAKRGSSKGMFKFNSGSIPAKGAAGNPIVVAVDKTRFLDGHPGFNASTVYGLTNDLTKYSAWASDTTISLDNGPTAPATTFNDQVVLLDAKDDIVDMIEYGTPTAPHPGNLPIVLSTSTVPEGVSYERCPAGVDTNGGYDPITPAASNIDFIVRGVPAETTPGVACQGVPGVNVQVVKTSGLTSASPGDLVPFTITYSNVGVNSNSGPVTLTDTLPNGLTFDSASPAPVVSNGGKTLMWSNLAAPEAGGIPSTIVVTATIDVGVPENAPLVNKVDIVAPNEPTDAATLSNNHSEATVVTLGPPILRVTLRPASQITAPPGTQFAYIVDYINSGQTDAADVTITTVLPQGLTLVSEDSTAGGWDGKTTGTITWNIGTIPANSSGEIVIVAQVSNSAVVDTVLPVSTTASSSNTPSVTQSNTVKVGLLKIFLPRVGK